MILESENTVAKYSRNDLRKLLLETPVLENNCFLQEVLNTSTVLKKEHYTELSKHLNISLDELLSVQKITKDTKTTNLEINCFVQKCLDLFSIYLEQENIFESTS